MVAGVVRRLKGGEKKQNKKTTHRNPSLSKTTNGYRKGSNAAASTSKSHTCIGRKRSVPAKKNKRETKDGVERIRPKWLMPSFIVLQYI